MAQKDFDIDIDVNANCEKSRYGVRAIIYDEENEVIQPHPSGYYLRNEKHVDLITGNCSIDYKDMECLGYDKVDLLTNSSYDYFNSKEEVLHYYSLEPQWERLKEQEFVQKLPHIHDHYEIVSEVQPQSMIQLADVLALIRPGKQHLLEQYIQNPDKTRKNLYRKPVDGGFYFKYSHSIAYAAVITTVMNYLTENETKSLFGI